MEVTAAEYNILVLWELKADSCVEFKMLGSEMKNNVCLEFVVVMMQGSFNLAESSANIIVRGF